MSPAQYKEKIHIIKLMIIVHFIVTVVRLDNRNLADKMLYN